jgi:hypothetical protein
VKPRFLSLTFLRLKIIELMIDLPSKSPRATEGRTDGEIQRSLLRRRLSIGLKFNAGMTLRKHKISRETQKFIYE